jgi:hypothetical protein
VFGILEDKKNMKSSSGIKIIDLCRKTMSLFLPMPKEVEGSLLN